MRILHTGDLHLGRYYKGELPRDISNLRREELFENFNNTINYIKNNDIDVLLISGDLYDKDSFSLTLMERIRDKFKEIEDVEVFIILGNHDYLNKDALILKVDFPKNVHIFKNDKDYFQIDKLNLRVYGNSWDKDINYTASINYNLDNSYTNLLMLHCNIDGKDYFPVKRDELSKLNFDYIALGHIHVRQKILNNCYYCGSPEPLSFKETGSHGFIIVDIKNNLINIHEVDSAIRNYNVVDVDVDEYNSFEEVKQKIDNKLNNLFNDLNLVRLNGSYKDINGLISYLKIKSKYFYIDFLNNLKSYCSIDELFKLNSDNILGEFIKICKDDLSLKYGIWALLETKNED